MSEAYIGEVRLFGGNFAPAGWADCDGALLSISDYDALYAAIGTAYGGDGQDTFALPDLRGRVPVGQGSGPGLTTRPFAQTGGAATCTLTTSQLPQHSHTVAASTTGGAASPSNGVPAAAQSEQAGVRLYTTATIGTGATTLASQISIAGSGQPHENMQPYLGIRYIICVNGIFPQRQ